MKKILLLLVLGVSLVSCTEEDTINVNDEIVGKWLAVKNIWDYQGQSIVTEVNQGCPDTYYTFEFKSNLKADFYQNDGNCGYESLETATWENVSEGRYIIHGEDNHTTTYDVDISDGEMTLVINENQNIRGILVRVE